MTLLRIYCPLAQLPQRCAWALIDGGREPLSGEGRLAELPRRADRVQVIFPAEQVLIMRARVPGGARRRAPAVLSYAVEEETLREPEANYTIRLGSAGDAEVLAIVDRKSVSAWLDALDAAGIGTYEVHCETLLLPWREGEWALAWDGSQGFVRTAELEGGATDCGDPQSPPLSLRMALEAAAVDGEQPRSIALYMTKADAAIDVEAWQDELGIPLRVAGTWDWRSAPMDNGAAPLLQRKRWPGFHGLLAQLRPAAWIAAAALGLHAVALTTDWSLLATQQRSLRQQMEARFRSAFPETVAVVDPALQMRRKLAEARHAAGQPDSGDFLPMIEKAGAAMKELPANSLRAASYESGRLTLELSADEAMVRRLVTRLSQAGLSVEPGPTPARERNATTVLTLRAS